MTTSVGIIGGGIVGITSALALQEAGYSVTVLEPEAVGSRTSYGNTGVLVDNPWLVANNPGLWRSLPRIIRNKDPRVRVDWRFVYRHLPLMAGFLRRTSETRARTAGLTLHRLLAVSQQQHKKWISATSAGGLLRATGWLKVFRSVASFKAFERELGLIRQSATAHRILSAREIDELEPGLRARFHAGLLLTGACSLTSPLALTERYLEAFRKGGGVVEKVRVAALDRKACQRWHVVDDAGHSLAFDQVVVAAGPWSADILAGLGYSIPLFWERGYHIHLTPGDGPTLTRAVHIVDDGFVMAPQSQGIRLTSGVEIAHRDSPPNYAQIDRAVSVARKVAALGAPVEDVPWMGSRPSIVDGLPMIGPAPAHDGLWFNFGHHHIGLSLSAGSALLLRALLQGATPPVDPAPFRPGRFGQARAIQSTQSYAASAAVPGVNLP